MKVKIKLGEGAVIPKYAKYGDACMDLVAISKEKQSGGIVTYGTGIFLEIPKGYVGLIFPRSSVYKFELSLSNSIGVIDSKKSINPIKFGSFKNFSYIIV